jgi:hypothetical protein
VTPRKIATFALGFVLAGSGPAGAHEFWLAPSRYRAATGDSVVLGAFVGTGFRGEGRPFAARRAVRFIGRGASVADLARGARDGSLAWARPAIADDQGTLVAYASDFATIELPAAEFERYLELEGLDAVARARAQRGERETQGRERYRRAGKTWIAGPHGESETNQRATTALGLPLEIVPLAEPGTVPRLTVEVRYEGRPLAGAMVRAWRQPLAADAATPLDAAARDSVGARIEGRTDARGRLSLGLADGPGEWLVSTVHMVPSRDREAADWESTWASLTFARRPDGEGSSTKH